MKQYELTKEAWIPSETQKGEIVCCEPQLVKYAPDGSLIMMVKGRGTHRISYQWIAQTNLFKEVSEEELTKKELEILRLRTEAYNLNRRSDEIEKELNAFKENKKQ